MSPLETGEEEEAGEEAREVEEWEQVGKKRIETSLLGCWHSAAVVRRRKKEDEEEKRCCQILFSCSTGLEGQKLSPTGRIAPTQPTC
ncbi:hypothetical protein FQN60_012357, partial [Etheostoma spectabile]